MTDDFDTSKLIDPKLDRFAILSWNTDRTVAQRNDGKEFKSAHNNPWYVLMTIAGEAALLASFEKQRDRAKNNRRYWHGFIGQVFDDEDWLNEARKVEGREEWGREDFTKYYAEELGVDVAEFDPLTHAETKKIQDEIKKRCGAGRTVPSPTSYMNFHATIFSSPLDVERSLFPNKTLFTHCHFAHYQRLGECYFSFKVSFTHCHFSNNAGFSQSTFDEMAEFFNCNFRHLAAFDNCIFHSHTFFHNCRFESIANFNHSDFKRYSSYDNTRFQAKTTFEGAHFQANVPNFYDVEFHPHTILSANEEDRKLWPPAANDKSKRQGKGKPVSGAHWLQSPQEQKAAYNVIRQFMVNQKKVEEEQFFYRREMETIEAAEAGFAKIPYAVFRLTSNFGHSILRPFLYLCLIWALGFTAFAFFGPPVFGDQNFWHYLANRAGLSLSNLFSYLGYTRLYFGDLLTDPMTPGGLRFIVAGQAFLAVVFQFLLGLGIRSRFRMR